MNLTAFNPKTPYKNERYERKKEERKKEKGKRKTQQAKLTSLIRKIW